MHKKFALFSIGRFFALGVLLNSCLKPQNTSSSKSISEKEKSDESQLTGLVPEGDEVTKMKRGLEYPYERLPYSFLLVGEKTYKLLQFKNGELDSAIIEVDGTQMSVQSFLKKSGLENAAKAKRTAILGYGANASPSALVSKYSPPKYQLTPVIPVVRASINDFDVVFSDVIGYYGTLQAALWYQPGVQTDVVINYLDQNELKRMHESELVGKYYDVGTLSQLKMIDEFGQKTDSVRLYNDLGGAFGYNGKPAAFETVNARGRSLPALSHEKIIQNVIDSSLGELGKGMTVSDVILHNLRWKDIGKSIDMKIRAKCIPIKLPNYKIEEGANSEARICEK
jgi:hypothetical protein